MQAMLVAHQFLEHEFDELRAKVSTDYARGRLATARISTTIFSGGRVRKLITVDLDENPLLRGMVEHVRKECTI
ncbi:MULTISPECIES: hypothetical protein [unclassified Bradyrhizobium]|uniref:hypothetical protein n=1 Tax=unclassified Bradyrhizobium TaxID=2631580 RepID=UPI0007095BB2|nr:MULTISPECIES: hypothetical protein [unclassified Bradyrhizobium]